VSGLGLRREPLRRLPVLAPAAIAPVVEDPAAGPVHAGADARAPLTDGLSRRIEYLRVSLTDRCNYRCTYCMPDEGVDLLPKPEILSFEEIERIIAALQKVGVRRVRLTGGEPTVRKDLLELVERLGRLGLDDLALSTNGERLVELAEPLRRAGLHRLNVSLDTLDADRFRRVTRRGRLDRVLAGLEAASAAGFRHTKINAVAMRGFNDDEIGALCRYAFARGFVPRFIELMPMADGALFYPGTFFPAAEIRAQLVREFGELVEPAAAAAEGLPGVGPARHVGVRFEGRVRRVGLISAVSEPFCDTCNRVRLSATGQLHACLAYDDAIDLRGPLRAGLAAGRRGAALVDPLVQLARAGLAHKRPGHVFTPSGCGGPQKHMVSIGG
jgi:cyclic pyranopterin phosphate synthase